MNLILASIGLGLLGIDVVGALLVLMALGQGVSRRSVALFVLIVFVGTAIYGVLLSVLLGEGINEIAALLLRIPEVVWKVAQVLLAVALAVWVFLRLSKRSNSKGSNKLARFKKSLGKGLVFAAFLFVLTAVLDPSFLALVAASGREGVLFDIIIAHLVWSFVGQIPLYVLAVAMLFNGEKVITDWFKRIWKRFGPKLAVIFTILIAALGIVLLVNAIIFFIAYVQ